jgi:GAF domain-containing protein
MATQPTPGADPVTLAWADRVADALCRTWQFQHCAVFLYDPLVDALRLVGQRWGAGEDTGTVVVGDWLVPLHGSVCGRVFRTGAPVLVPDARYDPDYRSFPGGTSRSEAAVPILVDGGPIGVINVESSRANAYGIADIDRLLEAADIAGRTCPAGARRSVPG